jgi:hypothetical protein
VRRHLCFLLRVRVVNDYDVSATSRKSSANTAIVGQHTIGKESMITFKQVVDKHPAT